MRSLILSCLAVMLAACSTFQPEALNYTEIEFANKKKPMEYGVYTPPGWQADERLPLILLLHGGGGSHLSFERYAADEFLDQEIAAGRIERAIIVTPDGDNGFWENWADGTKHYRDWVLDGVVPEVRANYRTLDCPDHCHLAGISMGGFGVLRMIYYARDTFSSVSAISAPIFNEQQAKRENLSWLIRLIFPFERIFGEVYTDEFKQSNPYNAFVYDPEIRDIRLQILWGSEDRPSIVESNQVFHERLLEANVAHDAFVYEGGHKWKYWVPNLGRVINFLVQKQALQAKN